MGSRETNTDVKLPVSAVGLIARLVPGIPSDLKVKFTQIRIEDGMVTLAAEVKSFKDVSRLTEVLQSNGFRVSSPGQEQIGPGRISATFEGPFEPNAAVEGGA